MANVTDSASLLTIPSGWSDGVLGSLKPDDGTGDFTFSRGSDLSATRVNENGYIERGYENLLLQSNNFDLSPWVLKPGATLTSGIADPDGSTNAWQLNFDGTANARIEQQATVTNNSVYTFSFYGRVSSGTKNIQVGAVGQLATKTLTTEWQRIELFGVTTTTITFPQIRTPDTSIYSIEIYQAQFNQGLVAYPYIESTTTTAKSTTILEDQPRIDYTSGNGAVLIEPSRTNLVTYSEYLLDGYTDTGCTITKTSETNPSGKDISYFATAIGNPTADRIRYFGGTKTGDYFFSFFAKGDGNAHQIYLRALGVQSGTASNMYWDVAADGTISFNATDSGANGNPITENYGNGWYRIGFKQAFYGANAYSDIRPSKDDINAGIYVWGVQWEQGSHATSYIPTYGTSSTRAKDTATLTKNVASTGTIYMNINSDNTKTLTFLGGNVSVTQGVNKIAMAYSPTALKISHNGTIVQNITRTFDTSALTQMQLGHRNNFEQTTDSINQFLTLDSFLTDTKLNELTA